MMITIYIDEDGSVSISDLPQEFIELCLILKGNPQDNNNKKKKYGGKNSNRKYNNC